MVHSQNGLWHLGREGNEFLLKREAELAWRAELPLLVEGPCRFYLSDRGWSILETQGVDWGEVLVVSPEGEICTRVALTDCENRATWPPAHLQQVILSPGSWPWNDGGSKPHFFLNHEGCDFFWWFLREDQRLAFGFSPPRKLDWSELTPLKDLMLQQELVWALSQLQADQGQASTTLRTALSVLVHQGYTGAQLQLRILHERLQSGVTRRSLLPPHPALCPASALLKLALWKLHGEAGPPLPELSGLSSLEVFAVAGSPDHIGWWRSDDRSEEGEF